ncbi:MAG: S8 family serine peptidase [Thaumarchaeota archaeon]|nr:S8 family serine peptidase [Nitrososphaerota archaeon]
MIDRLLIFSLFIIFCICLFLSGSNEQEISNNLQKSIELVGAKAAQMKGLEGQGIKIGVIDTGIDYNHPNLLGYGQSGKVIGGYDYVNPSENPLDINGHGTEVAGIIAADGNFTGIAPKSKLFSYKVSSTGEAVSSDYIVKAIQQAISDRVNVVNISLGINKTNDQIDNAIDEAVKKGIVIVVAAGNNGPQEDTIGSPGIDINAITVGASYNNLTSSLVATFEVDKKQYQVIPMVGVQNLPSPIEGKVVYGGYGRLQDLQKLDARGAILLEERGSDTKGQKVYFAEKEKNAADLGARALVVFNNDTGIFFGELVGPNKTAGYIPRIPVISMSKEDGLALKSMLTSDTTGSLNMFYHPDFIAPFSSQGPVSPFYIKPDLVAPGVFVNSTTIGGKYNLTSGTSFAAPHVAGAAAVILQKYPGLSPPDVASLLVTTTDPVTDAYGKLFPISAVGSGRLNITRALESNLIVSPHSLVFNLSFDNQSKTKTLHLRTLDSSMIPQLRASFSSNETSIGFDYSQSNDTLNIKISDTVKNEGDSDGFLILKDNTTSYRIPVVIHVTKGTLLVDQSNGTLYFSIDYPDKWSYAKISLINSDTGKVVSSSVTPQETGSIPVYEKGQYWLLAQIKDSNETEEAYQEVLVSQVAQKNIFNLQDIIGIPTKQVAIISGIMLITVTVGLTVRRKQN